MTDITELAQSMKAAAEKLKEIGIIHNYSKSVSAQIDFEKSSTPANVIALVEALEKAQQVDEELCKLLPPGVEYMDPPDGGDVTPLEGVRRMVADYRQLIAELESRTVTVKQYDEFQICHYGTTEDYAKGYIDCQNNFFKWLTAAGIKWEAE